MTSKAELRYDPETRQLTCQGDWDLAHFSQIQALLKKIVLPSTGEITIDAENITKMDSAGAWLLCQLQNRLKQQGLTSRLQHFSKEHEALLAIVQKRIAEEKSIKEPVPLSFVARVGQYAIIQSEELLEFLSFVGQLTFEAIRIGPKLARLRWGSLAGVIYRNGYEALPIIALLSFMIGIVIAYQMGLQLRNYGANVYIVDFQGIAVLREFGPLLTSIMVAGRTGSAFTAQLGMMKLNQEIDALDTMGVTPGELLILPRIVGLCIVLPLLTIWADSFGVIGGMVMAQNMMDITWYDFLHRFARVIPLRTLLIGLGKAPVFALIIASIGCFQGMKVQGGAESVGRNTTKSVVLAIFFIIVADAIFSVLFSKLQL